MAMNHSPYVFPFDGRALLHDFATSDQGKFDDKDEAAKHLKNGIERLSALQDKLYAQDKYAVLVIFQAMDAAGKDGTIKHVMSGINPQGCQVFSFKAPSAEELDHGYMWRCSKVVPERGRIGIFNRSYYEEVLVVRVHPSILAGQRLPGLKHPVGDEFWKMRFREMNDFERYLHENGTIVIKFFLNVSKNEQKKRFLDRIEDPAKNWKFSVKDVDERRHWDEYMQAYEDMLRHTSTPHAPWYVIPADRKWFMRALVCDIIVSRMEALDLAYPQLDESQQAGLQEAKKRLESED
ncbi:MAG: polyphosphate kinase 2 family protein [Lentimicrobiaceae bacterium]|nr:polyphosphate kinase 2 family protein [Lentimicrobiaceae bacterium]